AGAADLVAPALPRFRLLYPGPLGQLGAAEGGVRTRGAGSVAPGGRSPVVCCARGRYPLVSATKPAASMPATAVCTHKSVFCKRGSVNVRLAPQAAGPSHYRTRCTAAKSQPYGSIAQHRAARAGGTQFGAQFLGTGTGLRPDVDPRPTHAAACQPMVHAARLPPAQDGRVLLLQATVRGERRRIRRASDQLHAPGIQWLHFGGRRARDKSSDLLTGHGVCDVHLGETRLTPSPLLGGLPRYN